MVVRSVHGDVLVLVLVERGHERLEVLLAADFAHVLGREVGVHAGAVPVDVLAERLAVEVHIHAVLLAQADQEVAGHPDLVGRALGALAEHLEFPLALGHLGVDAFVVDAGVQAELEMRVDDLTGDAADVLVADAGVVLALRGREAAAGREAEGHAVLVEEVFLLEAEPGAGVVEDGGTGVRRMRGDAIGHHDLAHHQHAVLLGAVGVDRDRLEQAVGAAAFGLPRRAAVEAPVGQLLQLREAVVFLDLGLAAEVGDGVVPVQPDVFQFVFRHVSGVCCCSAMSAPDPSGPYDTLSGYGQQRPADPKSRQGASRPRHPRLAPRKKRLPP